MSRFLRNIGIMIIASISLSSCNENGYPIKGNTLVVTNEYAIDENLSLYTLKYEDTRAKGLGKPTSIIRMKYDRKAFEVGDKVKLIKSEE